VTFRYGIPDPRVRGYDVISVRRFVAVATVTAITALGATPLASSAAAALPPAAGGYPKCAPGHSNEHPASDCKAETDRSSVPRGGRVTVSGDGFYPGEAVSIAVHSILNPLSTVIAAADGAATATVTIPRTLSAGSHELILTGMSSTNELTAELDVHGASRAAGSSGPQLPAAVVPLAGTGLAMVLAGGLTLVGIRRRRRSRSLSA
jgi:hypothetical protein